MKITALKFFTLIFLGDRFLCDYIFTTLCDRVVFKQPQNSDELFYKEVVNSVYIKTDKVVDNFPLYANERSNIYFQYNKNLNAFYFSKPFPGESYYLGLGAEADATKMNDLKNWIKMADQKNDIFGRVVTTWFQYHLNKKVYLKEKLNITCSNSTDCVVLGKIFNADDFDWIRIIAIVLMWALPFLGPFMVWLLTVNSSFWRITSLWWYLSMVILICFESAAAIFTLQICGPILFSTMNINVAILIPIFYFYVLMEGQLCREKCYFITYSKTYDHDELDRYLNSIYDTEPEIFITVECYHFETKTDGSGEYPVTYQEKVISYTDKKPFSCRTWRDISDRNQIPSTRTKFKLVKLFKKFTFADQQTYNELSNIATNLWEANQNRDTHTSCFAILNLTGFRERLIGIDGKRPFWMNENYFQIALFLGLSWPYRWLFGFYTQKVKHLIIKEISINENLPQNINLAEQVSSRNLPMQSLQTTVQTSM